MTPPPLAWKFHAAAKPPPNRSRRRQSAPTSRLRQSAPTDADGYIFSGILPPVPESFANCVNSLSRTDIPPIAQRFSVGLRCGEELVPKGRLNFRKALGLASTLPPITLAPRNAPRECRPPCRHFSIFYHHLQP